jgi:hypothetical protein
MRRHAFSKLFKGLAALARPAFFISLPLLFIWHLAVNEHERRVEVLRTGYTATSTVTQSYRSRFARFRSRCVLRYQFQFNDQTYSGNEGACRLVDSHAVGSSLLVRFDSKDPQGSVVVGTTGLDLWPGWAAVVLLIPLSLLPLGGIVLYAIIRDAFGKPKQRKPAA